MQSGIEAMVWLLLPILIAGGSALLAFYIMQSKLEVAVSREREHTIEARAAVETTRRTMEESLRATEEATRRKAFDEFLGDFRVEERHYIRQSKSLFMNRKSMILQERLYFRNLPLSNWVEHEMVVEDGGDLQKLARACSVFTTKSMNEGVVSAARNSAQLEEPRRDVSRPVKARMLHTAEAS
jgi:hypothetical protein